MSTYGEQMLEAVIRDARARRRAKIFVTTVMLLCAAGSTWALLRIAGVA